MLLFSKESGQEKQLNVHDMQCMWYEYECGESERRQGNLRMAVKNYRYIEKHLDQVSEDQFDFHLYSMRKFTFRAYEEMIDMEDKIYENKFGQKACVGLIRCAKEVLKNREEWEEKFKPQLEEYYQSEEYKKLQKEIEAKDEDEEARLETDPKGYESFKQFIKDPIQSIQEFIKQCANQGHQNDILLKQCFDIYLLGGNLDNFIFVGKFKEANDILN